MDDRRANRRRDPQNISQVSFKKQEGRLLRYFVLTCIFCFARWLDIGSGDLGKIYVGKLTNKAFFPAIRFQDNSRSEKSFA